MMPRIIDQLIIYNSAQRAESLVIQSPGIVCCANNDYVPIVIIEVISVCSICLKNGHTFCLKSHDETFCCARAMYIIPIKVHVTKYSQCLLF